MSAMCQLCGSEQTNPDNGSLSKLPYCQECEKRSNSIAFNGEYPSWNTAKSPDGSSPYATPLISPALSLSSYGSCMSNCGGAYMNSQIRDGVEGFGTDQKYPSLGFAKPLEGHGNGSFPNNADAEHCNAKDSLNGMMFPMSVEEYHTSNSNELGNNKSDSSDKVGPNNSTLDDVSHRKDGDDSDGTENVTNKSAASFVLNTESDPRIWIPPEPEDPEHDIDSVANNDDDDEYSDGTQWGQPSSLSSLDEEQGNYRSYKEERQKAMMEAMNGQFKILVSRLLASEGIILSDTESANNWLDIVTSLSWEAALLIKPDANEGRAMDPGSYVKVKCIASGSHSQSQVINGLVFKKNTAHKHMPTKLRNPRLLLLQGSLGHSAARLSSFKSMEQENDNKKSTIEMIESCHPNVVLVEKTVSRDFQESLLEKGITLVLDMKLPRLERIARCTGAQIVSSADILVKPKLKQCDSFHIEKFVEEHIVSGEGGKKPSKTLMFLEGFPKPLGCTILLKGAHSDELKKVKSVVHYTVFAAYHLILETSFMVDQRAFCSDMHDIRGADSTSVDEPMPSISRGDGSTAGLIQAEALDIPISDGSVDASVHDGTQFNSELDARRSVITSARENTLHGDLFGAEPNSDEIFWSDSSVQPLLPGQLLSSVSASLKKFLGDNLPPLTSESISSYFGFNGKAFNSQNSGSVVSLPLETFDRRKEANGEVIQEEPVDGVHNDQKAGFLSNQSETTEHCGDNITKEVQIESNGDIESALDPRSILVLLSSQCIPKQMVCEQSHLSRIKYYGNFDMSLGRYLQDILLNQKHSCASCGEPPEAHVYRYTHQNGNLTVLVRCLPRESTLSGEAEGKIWMWTRCLKCERESGIPKSTRRVVMSSAARGLSFGKFLELSFSTHSAASRLSRCGHLLHRDCLRFFGLGSKVAMFRYSSVEIYAACKPPPVLEFYNPIGQEWFVKEARDVLAKGNLLFVEVGNLLQKLKSKCSGALSKLSTNISGPVEGFDEVEEMLIQEKTEFEASLLKVINHNAQIGKDMHETLDLNWQIEELLLMLYVWDRRLHSILLDTRDGDSSTDAINREQSQKPNDVVLGEKHVEGNITENIAAVSEAPIDIPVSVEFSSEGSHEAGNITILEINPETESDEVVSHTAEVGCANEKKSAEPMTREQSSSVFNEDFCTGPANYKEESISIMDNMQEDHSRPLLSVPIDNVNGVTDQEPKSDIALNSGEAGFHILQKSRDSKDQENWIWSPFSELRREFRNDLRGGSLQKFEFINTYIPTCLPPMRQLVTQALDSLHFSIGPDGNIISATEDEISSIIACALALSEDQYGSSEKIIEKEGKEGRVETDEATVERLISNGSAPLSHSASTGSLDTEGMRSSSSFPSFLSDELAALGSDGSLFMDRLIFSENLHPEVPVGSGKIAGKNKYSVVCIYAKQFYSLRRRCCPSEEAYISSLRRCKKWNAQGGKTKAFFAKTMDDRFIIKQIKKPELESFLKFGPDYFKHISLSLDSGSQTCLAKILGIYQVRQYKSGKEVKIDVMVMENLLFGRKFSRTYDLKGAVFSRYVQNSDDPEGVLLDENFVEDMRVSPIYVGGKTKHLLQRAIWNDTSFLTSINVMDYSLLVGVDSQKHEIIFGIIDYLRQYTWDKQLETWVKSSLVVPKNELPTVISPKEYKKRFRKFMTKYFLTVPDTWSSEQCSGSCKFCNDGSSSSFKFHNEKLPEE